MDSIKRTFEDSPGIRGDTPLLVGLSGPSGGGKTKSALRLATGMQRITGGDIFGIDTEARRMLHYADQFKFRHVPFNEPFSPLDYLAAIEHCISKGAKTIIVDSMSHEHAGPGGVLDEHDQEVERLSKLWGVSAEKANAPAWGKPKAKRNRLIQKILQTQANFIFCFRAKDKIKLGGGKIIELGFMPIAGEEFVFEMTANALLMPNANGVPTWNPIEIGEKMMVKLPDQFKAYFSRGQQLDEDAGQFMAEWAAGVKSPSADEVVALVKAYDGCNKTAFDKNEVTRKLWWPMLTTDQKTTLKTVSDLGRPKAS